MLVYQRVTPMAGCQLVISAGPWLTNHYAIVTIQDAARKKVSISFRCAVGLRRTSDTAPWCVGQG